MYALRMALCPRHQRFPRCWVEAGRGVVCGWLNPLGIEEPTLACAIETDRTPRHRFGAVCSNDRRGNLLCVSLSQVRDNMGRYFKVYEQHWSLAPCPAPRAV